jgi:hypothetical protein
MAHGPEDVKIWRNVVPEEAVLHDFLMDGLLALSSLHFASQNPNLQWQYTEIAIKYQNLGLQKYKYALEKITNDNSRALFAFSIIINILALAFPNVCPGPMQSSHAEGLMTMLELVQGVGLINHVNETTGVSFRHAEFAALFPPLDHDGEEPALHDDIVHALLRLRERADSITECIGSDKRRAYLTGIEGLEETFRSIRTTEHLGPIIAWPAVVGHGGLLRLFKNNDPMAQFIFLHYGVLLLHARDRWWGRDTGASLVEYLANSLHDADPEWIAWTQWARETAAMAT